MNRLCLSVTKQTIAIFIFMVAAMVPVCSQEVATGEKPRAGQTTGWAETDNLAQTTNELSVDAERGRKIDGDVKIGSRFALIAGETPAVPALIAGETPAVLTNQSTTTSTNQKTNQPYVFPTPKERFNRYVKSVVGPSSLLRSAINAGVNQWRDKPEEWEQGASGYGKRYASTFGRNAIQHTVIYGLDSALGWDTGFRKSTRTGFFPRAKDALAYNITSRTKTGKRVISVPRIAGAYTSGVISREAWYPERYSYKDGLRSGTNSLLTGFALNLVREFVFSF